jgi:hypothetical protein
MENEKAAVSTAAVPAQNPAAGVGPALKEARKKKNTSLEEAKQHTKIPRKFLEALEDNRFDVFPAKAYLRGFLKNYCDYLDIDFDPLWKSIEAANAQTAETAAETHASPAPSGAPTAHHAGEHLSSQWPDFDARSIGAFVLSALLAVGVLSWAIYSRDRKILADAPGSLPNVLKPLGNAAGYTIAVALSDAAWIRLVCDGSVQFEGQAPSHSQETCKAYQSVVFKTNDASAVALSVNGSTVTLPAPDSSDNYHIPLQ